MRACVHGQIPISLLLLFQYEALGRDLALLTSVSLWLALTGYTQDERHSWESVRPSICLSERDGGGSGGM